MFSFKRFFILIITVAILTATAAAQMTVEESYLQESIELMIIREAARSNSREQKLISLEYIRDAIERGSTNDEIRQTLQMLSQEGRRTVVREGGRVVNNYPDVRRQAARYLGQMGTDEARQSLLLILQSDNEPMVLQEAIKALGDIGANPNNETVIHIAWVMDRFLSGATVHPDNLMALATIDAFEKIAKKNNGFTSPEAIRTLNRIIDGPYVMAVRERARQLMADLRSSSR